MLRIHAFNKGFGKIGHTEKVEREKYLTEDEVKILLDTIRKADRKTMVRDHAAIFLGFYFAMRAGEAAILDAHALRSIEKGVAYIRTLKRRKRIKHRCENCKRSFTLSRRRAGTMHRCTSCASESRVAEAKDVEELLPSEVPMSIITSDVIEYARDYMKSMRANQAWLFESSKYPGKHLSPCQLQCIFNAYLMRSGLNPKYSWHALRHGRGVQLWEVSGHDAKVVQDGLRHSSPVTSMAIYAHMSPERRSEILKLLDKRALDVEFEAPAKKAAN